MRTLCVVVAMVCAAPAFGQAPQQDLQPAVNTSAMTPQPAADSSAPTGTRTAARTSAPATAKATAPAAKAAKGGKASDRIDLDTTDITGNKELPKVMYVVPWKHSDLGDLTGKPPNSLVDEILQPVDRDVFNREERYYHTVAPEKSPVDSQSGSPAAH
jgi:hypothetical protein